MKWPAGSVLVVLKDTSGFRDCPYPVGAILQLAEDGGEQDDGNWFIKVRSATPEEEAAWRLGGRG